MLRQKLKEANQQDNKKNNQSGEDKQVFPIFLRFLCISSNFSPAINSETHFG
jgi:hypothetical protein